MPKTQTPARSLVEFVDETSAPFFYATRGQSPVEAAADSLAAAQVHLGRLVDQLNRAKHPSRREAENAVQVLIERIEELSDCLSEAVLAAEEIAMLRSEGSN